MTIAFISVAAILSLIVLLVLYWPWLEPADLNYLPASPSFDRLQELLHERTMVLENLKDLEQDLEFEKIEKVDYDRLKAKFLSQAGRIYTEIEELEAKDPLLQKITKDIESLS